MIYDKTMKYDKTSNNDGLYECCALPEPTWKDRLREEYCQTKERYEKLHKLIVKYEAGTLDFKPKYPLDLLKKQASNMGQYLYCLEIRAEIEKIPLNYAWEKLDIN